MFIVKFAKFTRKSKLAIQRKNVHDGQPSRRPSLVNDEISFYEFHIRRYCARASVAQKFLRIDTTKWHGVSPPVALELSSLYNVEWWRCLVGPSLVIEYEARVSHVITERKRQNRDEHARTTRKIIGAVVFRDGRGIFTRGCKRLLRHG